MRKSVKYVLLLHKIYILFTHLKLKQQTISHYDNLFFTMKLCCNVAATKCC